MAIIVLVLKGLQPFLQQSHKYQCQAQINGNFHFDVALEQIVNKTIEIRC
ncbi:hypothetical protein CLV98_10811 [Dyadobacter jejuensis]|uniref:Uncharacterized protein n=1 Tax=Dyadobacter jejuensis TaxID=1082580 RepID=A0A316AHE8_9BACT|nr:hypothetical protein CLV98_10811 [Dyadobacter jejuensis]